MIVIDYYVFLLTYASCPSFLLCTLFSDQLEGIGFVWNVREGRTPWSQRFEELKEYKEKYG